MAKNDNLKDFLVDVAEAIREKEGSADPINPQEFSDRIRAISGGGGVPARPTYTGHADAEGLRAIGWTDEDIAYYQENGVNWNEEDDEYHKVSEDNKALYGVLTADNISQYKGRIVYLPKIDISGVNRFTDMFKGHTPLVAIPLLDTQNVTAMDGMFSGCRSLVCIPALNTEMVTTMANMFYDCDTLVTIPSLNTQNVTAMKMMFYGCMIVAIPPLNTQKVTTMTDMFNSCSSLVSIPALDTQSVTNMASLCYNCASLTSAYVKNVKISFNLNRSGLLSKDSLLYIINNEAATSAITITLASYAYTRLANDADIVAALADHPNISLASA